MWNFSNDKFPGDPEYFKHESTLALERTGK